MSQPLVLDCRYIDFFAKSMHALCAHHFLHGCKMDTVSPAIGLTLVRFDGVYADLNI